eukprot:1191738-Prorocentrum_minimum.AAC.2
MDFNHGCSDRSVSHKNPRCVAPVIAELYVLPPMCSYPSLAVFIVLRGNRGICRGSKPIE